MSAILGHDIDGNPLRAGDRAVMVCSFGRIPNESGVLVMGPPLPANRARGSDVQVEWSGSLFASDCCRLRKLPPKTDHEPADEEFTEWLKGMNVGQPA